MANVYAAPPMEGGVFSAMVVGAGHGGIEAALALARMGVETALLTMNLDSIGMMPCNPAIGGTGRGTWFGRSTPWAEKWALRQTRP